MSAVKNKPYLVEVETVVGDVVAAVKLKIPGGVTIDLRTPVRTTRSAGGSHAHIRVEAHDTMVAAANLRRVADQLVQVGLETLDHAVHNAQSRKGGRS